MTAAAAIPTVIPAQDAPAGSGLSPAAKKTSEPAISYSPRAASQLLFADAQIAKAGVSSGGSKSQQTQPGASWSEMLAAQGDFALSAQAAASAQGVFSDAKDYEETHGSSGGPDLQGLITTAKEAPSSHAGSGRSTVSAALPVTSRAWVGLKSNPLSSALSSPATASSKPSATSSVGVAGREADSASEKKPSSDAKTKERSHPASHVLNTEHALVAPTVDKSGLSQALASAAPPAASSAKSADIAKPAQPSPPLFSESSSLSSSRALPFSGSDEAAIGGGNQKVSIAHAAVSSQSAAPSNFRSDLRGAEMATGASARQISLSQEQALGTTDRQMDSFTDYLRAQSQPGDGTVGGVERGKAVEATGALQANPSLTPPLADATSSFAANDPSSAAGRAALPSQLASAVSQQSAKERTLRTDMASASVSRTGTPAGKQPAVQRTSEAIRGAISTPEASGLITDAGIQPIASQSIQPARAGLSVRADAVSPFQAMDAPQSGGAAEAASPVHASSSAAGLSAGYHDPQLGYVELKAHLGSDGVRASLAATTPEGATILAGHMPALHQWLHERQTPVETLSVGLKENNSERSFADTTGRGNSSGGDAFASGQFASSSGRRDQGDRSGSGAAQIDGGADEERYSEMRGISAASPAIAAAVNSGSTAAYISVLA